MPEGARPVFAEGKDRQRLRFFGWAHLSLGEMMAECLEMLSNLDLSVSNDRAPAWSPPKGGDHAQASEMRSISGGIPRLRGW